ncbi:MAG: CDP-alcohol phosphatidyltransferase family protein [Deltaproteobacteria bacterium]|nr:CDP-alcohol phosphatidyltransferase family protein [Deltaproteobacteria bacterium]MCW5807718.1 CDP-alcohol phosphatidyltransferase family protein [Deltaproteobacteria bacterium]
MRSRWNDEWWSITFGGPIGSVVNALIAEVWWITPNRITWLSFLCKLAAAPLLLAGTPRADLAVVVLLQVHTVLDCMDGSLARYRGASSVMGAFLDKATDMIGLLAIMACFGWRVYRDTGDAFAISVALLIAGAILLRSYLFWVVHALERDRKVPKPTVGDRRRDFSMMSVRERAVMMLKSQWKIINFSEADLYFWLALGIAIGHMREMVYVCGVANGFWACVIVGFRFVTVVKLDRAKP